MRTILLAAMAVSLPGAVLAQDEAERVTEGNLVMENIPDIPQSVHDRLMQYGNTRSAGLQDFAAEGLLVSTRFGETSQIHHVTEPMGMRRQLTFFDERVGVTHGLQEGDATLAPSLDLVGKI